MPTAKPENLAQLVLFVRGEKVMLDTDLAMLYRVDTGALNRAVKRNLTRFPEDFMFRLTAREWENLKSQIGISSPDRSTGRNTMRSQIVTSKHGGRRRINAMEKKYDEQFAVVFDAIKRLIAEDDVRKAQPKRRIGFTS